MGHRLRSQLSAEMNEADRYDPDPSVKIFRTVSSSEIHGFRGHYHDSTPHRVLPSRRSRPHWSRDTVDRTRDDTTFQAGRRGSDEPIACLVKLVFIPPQIIDRRYLLPLSTTQKTVRFFSNTLFLLNTDFFIHKLIRYEVTSLWVLTVP